LSGGFLEVRTTELGFAADFADPAVESVFRAEPAADPTEQRTDLVNRWDSVRPWFVANHQGPFCQTAN